MSVQRDVDVDLEDNSATVRVVTTVAEVFDEDGELRLWEDSEGWSGYVREERDDGSVAYYRVNTVHSEDSWLEKVRVGQQAVHDAIQRHIQDPDAGGAGNLVRRCTP